MDADPRSPYPPSSVDTEPPPSQSQPDTARTAPKPAGSRSLSVSEGGGRAQAAKLLSFSSGFAAIMSRARSLSNDTPSEPVRSPGSTPPAEGRWANGIDVERSNGAASPRDHGPFTAPGAVSTPGQKESSLHRAGLLQPKSYASSYTHVPASHAAMDIRSSTMHLSGMNMNPTPSPAHATSFIFPSPPAVREDGSETVPLSTSIAQSARTHLSAVTDDDAGELHASTSSLAPTASTETATTGSGSADGRDSSAPTPRARSVSPGRQSGPSGLSLLIAQGKSGTTTPNTTSTPMQTPTDTKRPAHFEQHVSSERPHPPSEDDASSLSESTPLLAAHRELPRQKPLLARLPAPSWKALSSRAKENLSPHALAGVSKTAVKSIPAVILGCLLNILDGVSYGMILFPAAGVFVDLGGMGVSMFFVTTVIAQLVYSFGGSGFAGANGSMMIEVVPFFHILASSIAKQIGENKPVEIIATTLVAYAFSSILTGLTFFLLGALKLGVIIGFFPRHILVGWVFASFLLWVSHSQRVKLGRCIGGVGAFLLETGLTVSTRIDDDELSWDILQPHNLAMWLPALSLALLLRIITHKFHHQLIFPLYFLVIPIVFYIVVAAARLNLGNLRTAGWIFDMGNSADEKWYKFYTYLDFGMVRWAPLWATLPTQFALLFFNILHPPLNVPALSVSLNEDVDTNKELVAHGYSNLLAGLFGTVPNYLVYVNTLLFYRVGGGTRTAGFMLAGATVVLLLIGTGPIAYIPVMVVGALIFVLGIDLVKEALWDTRHRTSRSEYVTIISIMVVMTVWDFVMGVLWGIIVSCFFFVVQNSRRRSIRALYTGETAMSTVRRPGAHRAYIREVSKQTTILRLQGFLFFGTITHVEETIRNIIEGPLWQKNPVRFLVLDLSLVAGVDMSSAEALVRVQRMLESKGVVLVFCGFSADSSIGKALSSVGVLGAAGVELFSSFNDAMEWTENAYLKAWFRSQKAETSAMVLPGRQDLRLPFYHSFSLASSPRRSQLRDVGNRTIANEDDPRFENATEPFSTVERALGCYGELDREAFRPLVSYLERVSAPEGLVLWKQGDPSDGLYLIESGVLRASYRFADHIPVIEESMVPGTLAGELSALAHQPRNATMHVERQAVLWKLSVENLERMEKEHPELARTFTSLVVKAAKIDYDVLLSALASRQ